MTCVKWVFAFCCVLWSSTLWAQTPSPSPQAKNYIIPGLSYASPALTPLRRGQVIKGKARANMGQLRATIFMGPNQIPQHRIGSSQSVPLLRLSTYQNTQRPVVPPSTPSNIKVYDRYVQDLPNATATPPKVSYKARQSPVRAQGGRGTCVAFAIVAAMEALYRSNHQIVDLSEQDAYFSLKAAQNGHICHEGSGINGATLARLSQAGVSLETHWPYQGTRESMGCTLDESQLQPLVKRPIQAVNNNKWGPIFGQYMVIYRDDRMVSDKGPYVNNPRQIEAWLALGYEVYLAVGVANSLSKSGVIDVVLGEDGQPLPAVAGHAMLVVGYDKANGGVFELKNSWGTGVGQQGYVKLSYDYVRTYGWEAAILIKLRGVSESAPSTGLPVQNTGSTPQVQAAPTPTAQAIPPLPSYTAAQQQQIKTALEALKSYQATANQAKYIWPQGCTLKDSYYDNQTRTSYSRILPLWLMRATDAGVGTPRLSCTGGPCVYYTRQSGGGAAKLPESWLPVQLPRNTTSAQRQQAVKLWDALLSACRKEGGGGGDKA